MLPLLGIELWFQVQHYPFWANWAFACKTETKSCSIDSTWNIQNNPKINWSINRILKIPRVAHVSAVKLNNM